MRSEKDRDRLLSHSSFLVPMRSERGLPLKTVQSRLRRSRLLIRNILEKEGITNADI